MLKRLRWHIVITLASLAAAAYLITTYDPNQTNALHVVVHAGIQPGTHVGPPQGKDHP